MQALPEANLREKAIDFTFRTPAQVSFICFDFYGSTITSVTSFADIAEH